jgi:hypothetical protein
MDCKQTLLASAIGVALLFQPAMAGGPVLTIEEKYETAEPAPRNDWIVPVIIGGLIICAIACGGDDDPAPVDPGPVCNSGCE